MATLAGRFALRNHHAPPAITTSSAASAAASGARPKRLFCGVGATGATGSAGFAWRRDADLQRIDPDRPFDVLELGLPEIGDLHIEPAAHLPVGVLGQADRPRFGDAFEPRGDVDAIAHEIAVGLLDNIAQMNADAEHDATVFRHARVALDEAVLNLDRAAHRVDHAAELDDRAVSGALDDAAVVDGDGGVEQIAAQRPQPRQNAILVRSREPAVADNIRDQDRRDFSGFAH